MLESAISACHGAGSTYSALAAWESGSERSSPVGGSRQVFDVVVNPLSAPFRSSESYGAAFCSELPSVFRTSGCLTPIELARPTATPWNGSGNAMKPWEHLSQTVMAFTSSSTSRCS